jgi:ATP-dependent DNA helicase RecG
MFADPTTDEAVERMRAVRECADGFALAEEDLRIRGEGSLFGTRQSGLPDLRLVRLTRDFDLIKRARAEAFAVVKSDPGLARPEHRLLLRETARRFPGTLGWLFKG